MNLDGIDDGDELVAGTDRLDESDPPPTFVSTGSAWGLVAALAVTAGWALRRWGRRQHAVG